MGPEGDEGGVELAKRHGAEDGPVDRAPVALEKLGDAVEEGQREGEACVSHGHVHRDANMRVVDGQW